MHKYNDKLYNWRGIYHYRKTPVPSTSSRHRFSYNIKHPKTTNEIRQNSIPSYKIFVRGKRRKLPTSWDDMMFSYQRSWKRQKKRKQWMKSR